MNPRSIGLAQQLLAAAQAICGVLEGRSLSDTLERTPADLRPAAQALSFHAMRQLGFAQAAQASLVPRRPANRLTEAMLLLGLCLLEARLREDEGQSQAPGTPLYAEHTLVNQLVQAAAADRHTRPAKNMINAVLRRYGRERNTLLAQIQSQGPARWNHPDWWIQAMQQAWPEHWQAILQSGECPPPMTLRVNTRQISRTDFLARLTQAEIAAHPVGTSGVQLAQPRPVREIPGFTEGWWSVQDISAQQAGELLPLQDGMRVLDACAAPGGKTAHLLERARLELTALDSDATRLARVNENLQRLQLLDNAVSLQCADAADPAAWWDGQPYDVILADVPCTASGVVRRHPDIRWLRRATDLKQTAALQARIIDALWPLLKPSGHLLYATCSVFPQEGEQQIQAFMTRHPEALRLPAPGHMLPGLADTGDGFFYALIRKPA